MFLAWEAEMVVTCPQPWQSWASVWASSDTMPPFPSCFLGLGA